MTLIASLRTPFQVLQVSDRLVSYRGDPVDPEANKVILYSGPDAILAIGFAGPASIAGAPTDQWIVEQITQRSIELRDGLPLYSQARHDWPTFSDLVDRLKTSIRNAFFFDENSVADPTGRFQISLTGWALGNATKARSLLHLVTKEEGELFSEARLLDEAPVAAHMLLIGSKPKEYVTPSIESAIKSILRDGGTGGYDDPMFEAYNGNPIGRAERVLVDTIKNASQRDPTIGGNTMSIHIPHPANRTTVETLYTHDGRIADRNEALEQIQETYSPWIVAKGDRWPPRPVQGARAYQLDNGWYAEVGGPVIPKKPGWK